MVGAVGGGGGGGNGQDHLVMRNLIVALRDERGSYNTLQSMPPSLAIVALRDERGSYNKNRAGIIE